MGAPGTCHVIFDVDWAPDFVVDFAVDQIEALGIEATVFVTHESPALDRLRAAPRIEIGAHPNFNDLLLGTAPDGDDMRARIEALRALLPEARAVRSHSLTQNSRMLDLFGEFGFTHEANTLIPGSSGMRLAAWRHWDGRLVRIPCLFEDSVADLLPRGWSADDVLGHPGLRVLNFHPIRLYLNARSVELPREASVRPLAPEVLDPLRCPETEIGSLHFLREVVTRHRAAGGRFAKLSEIEPTKAASPAAPLEAAH